MSSRKGVANPSSAGASDPSFKGKGISNGSNHTVEQLSSGVSDMILNPAEDDGWEEYGKKSKNKNRNNASKQRVPQYSSSTAWGHGGQGRGYSQTGPNLSSDSRKPAGRGYTKPQPINRGPDSGYVVPTPVIPPPLKNGWGWSTRTKSGQSSEDSMGHKDKVQPVGFADDQTSKVDEVEDGDEESEDIDDTDDELLSDGFDSDESQKSHETRKQNRWFKELFQSLDGLTVVQINEPEREWHCPACKGGPGAIDWYRGLQPLITHARTKRSKRVKLHRELALLLDEELRRRGTSAQPAGETFGIWKGLEQRADREIVWPPMVIIMNTRHEKDENDKWIGMGNTELLEYFSSYAAVKPRHSYGPQGHRGMSALIFEASAVGYAEAERLSKHFADTGRDRLAWERNKVPPFYSGGQRQLYGYMAEKKDLENFNQHSQGKSKLKYEMRSYQEMVVNQMKQMSEDNQQLIWLKNKVAKEQRSKKALEESYGAMSQKLRQTVAENHIVKLRTKKHHEKNKEQMDFQEQFFSEQMQQFYDARNLKEENFEKIQQQMREKITKSETNVSSADGSLRREEIAKRIQVQDKKVEEFVQKREKLMKAHEERMSELMRRHWDEKVALEEEFDEEFNKLIAEYTPSTSEQ